MAIVVPCQEMSGQGAAIINGSLQTVTSICIFYKLCHLPGMCVEIIVIPNERFLSI